MTENQAAAFLIAAEQRAPAHYPYFATLMLAGLRPGEGLGVTEDRIDLRRRALLVDRQIGQHGGLKTTKTGEERAVDLSAHLAVLLDATIQARTADDARSKVVPICVGAAQADGARADGRWLFFPELGQAPTRQDAQRLYKHALRAMRRAVDTPA